MREIRTMRAIATSFAVISIGLCAIAAARAQHSGLGPPHDGSYSIMVPEGGEKAVPQDRHRRAERPRKRRIGSSSPPPPPPPSVVTPLGVAPGAAEVPRLTTPGSGPTVIPGQFGNAGPAIAPARPAGQSFQDRTVGCVHSGSSQGVGPGQIGGFTQGCVNQ